MNHRNQSNSTFYRRVFAGGQGPDVQPVPEKDGTAILKEVATFFFRIGGHTGRGDGADRTFYKLQSQQSFRPVEKHLFRFGIDPISTIAPEDFEEVGYQAFVLFALP